MKIVHNVEEFKKLYYYDPKHLTEKDFPESYPCVLELVNREAGIMGDYIEHRITVCPEGLDFDSWFQGYKTGVVNGQNMNQL